MTATPQKKIGYWLLVCCAMVFIMVVLGGVTRLMHAGLSIVEWKPLVGALPPLSDAAWQDLFAQYQAFPEYQKINQGMTLHQFKEIFWLEYFHRLWGRSIGVVFLLPFLYFLVTGAIRSRSQRLHFTAIFLLGGLQGALGWFMVKSGLVDRPDVSQYRLSAHLIAAFAIYGYMFWIALGLILPRQAVGFGTPSLKHLARLLCLFIPLTVVSGGFVAGLDAGLAYNTFPLMNGDLIPPDILPMSPLWRNFFEDVTTVQFNHRLLAIATLGLVLGFTLQARAILPPSRARLVLHGLLATALAQVAMGIATLLLYVPVPLAAAHQAGALVLFTMALWIAYELHPD